MVHLKYWNYTTSPFCVITYIYLNCLGPVNLLLHVLICSVISTSRCQQTQTINKGTLTCDNNAVNEGRLTFCKSGCVLKLLGCQLILIAEVYKC